MTELEEDLTKVNHGHQITTKNLRRDWYNANQIIYDLQTIYGHPITNTAKDKIGIIKFLRSDDVKELGNWQHLEHTIRRLSKDNKPC